MKTTSAWHGSSPVFSVKSDSTSTSRHDGDTGLEQALTGAYDALIVDWMLPGRDGVGDHPRATRGAYRNTGADADRAGRDAAAS